MGRRLSAGGWNDGAVTRIGIVGGGPAGYEAALVAGQLGGDVTLADLPSHLVVVGSGVTGAEFASAYLAMGARVSLVSSRERVLPGEDSDAAELLQQVFERRGMNIVRGRAARVERSSGGVVVHLQ